MQNVLQIHTPNKHQVLLHIPLLHLQLQELIHHSRHPTSHLHQTEPLLLHYHHLLQPLQCLLQLNHAVQAAQQCLLIQAQTHLTHAPVLRVLEVNVLEPHHHLHHLKIFTDQTTPSLYALHVVLAAHYRTLEVQQRITHLLILVSLLRLLANPTALSTTHPSTLHSPIIARHIVQIIS